MKEISRVSLSLYRRALVLAAAWAFATSLANAYQCAGMHCDFSDLQPSDCQNYTETLVVTPTTPTSPIIDPNAAIGPGITRSCQPGSGYIELKQTYSQSESETISATGTAAATIGAKLEGDVETLVGAEVSGSVTLSVSGSWSWQGTNTDTWELSCHQDYGNCQTAWINATTTRTHGSFTNSEYFQGAWENSTASYAEACQLSSASGSAAHWAKSVNYDAGVKSCTSDVCTPQTG